MDYTRRAALLCCTLCLSLFAISFIPPQRVLGVELRRANLLSGLINFSDEERFDEVELTLDEEEFEVNLEEVALSIEALEVSTPDVELSYSWEAVVSAADIHDEEVVSEPHSFSRRVQSGELTPIEDFDSLEVSAMRRLYQKLLRGDSLVRIAVLGDSFVEADILTCDLREALQSQFGGCGAGFTPISTPLTGYRPTIKTSSKGWTSHNVMQRKTTPEPYNTLFSISGWVCRPTNGATTSWSCSSARQHIDSCQRVKFHFVALRDALVEVSINDDQSQRFEVEASSALRQIELSHGAIRTAQLKVVSGGDGFVGYGALFEGRRGVSVDNYSVRSNNGQAMFWTNAAINAQIDKALGGYDLVVLQYGLNIMQRGVSNYTAYAKNVEKMISYVRQCFPRAAVVVMGVSDRSMKSEGVYTPMVEAQKLAAYQRSAAENCGAAFWNTYSAMQQQGGMSHFVAQGWAGKDYTHINFNGGRQVAWSLYDAINHGVEVERAREVRVEELPPIIDSTRHQQILRELLQENK